MGILIDQMQSRNAEEYRESVFFARGTNDTGIASLAAPTSFDDALAAGSSNRSALLNIFNTSLTTTTGAVKNVWIVPLCIRLTVQTANSSAVSLTLIGALDNKDRFTSGGTVLTSESTSMDTRTAYASRTNRARLNFGLLVTTAENSSGSSAVVHNTRVADVVLAEDDVIEVWFGQNIPHHNMSDNGNVFVVSVPPVWIGRGCSYTLYDFAPSQTADAEFIPEITYLETAHPRQS